MFYNGLIMTCIVTPEPKQGSLSLSAGRIKLFSKNVANCYQSQITELHSLKICNSVASSQLEKEHNSIFHPKNI